MNTIKALLFATALLFMTACSTTQDKPLPAGDAFGQLPLHPFWEGREIRESLFFIQHGEGERARSALLFEPEQIISLTSATRETVYEEGKDYVYDAKTNTIQLPAGSGIPFKTQEQMYPLMSSDVPKIGRQAGDKTRGIFFDNKAGYHRLQLEITYRHDGDEWDGPRPEAGLDQLPNVGAKLKTNQPFKLTLLGDSISAGYNATKFTKAPPYTPAYGELVALALQERFGNPVEYNNHAVGGWNAQRGLNDAVKRELSKQELDLVMIAFGMNDVFGRNPQVYQATIEKIITTIREGSPKTEFVLVGTMTGNAEWGMPMEQFGLYLAALHQIAEKHEGVIVADLTTFYEHVFKTKSFYDLTGNGVNHPNDFGHLIYAQVILKRLSD